MVRRCGVLAWLSVLVAAPALAEGGWPPAIPEEAFVQVVRFSVPAFGAREPRLGEVRQDQERGFTIAFEERQVLGETDMIGRWSFRAYSPSPVGSACVVYTDDGFLLHDGAQSARYRLDLGYVEREFCWHPSGKRAAFWAQSRQVGLFELDELVPGQPPGFRVLYRAQPGHEPVGMCWDARGEALLVSEVRFPLNNNAPPTGALLRVPLDGSPVREILRNTHPIWSVKRVPSEGLGLLAHDQQGLFQVEGTTLWRFRRFQTPALGDFEPNPTNPWQAALCYREGFNRPAGVYLVDLDGHEDAQPQQVLSRHTHTLRYSARGTYLYALTLATGRAPAEVHVLRADDPRRRIVIQQRDEAGRILPITGVDMNPAETQLAYSAAGRVFVYDLASGLRVQVGHFKERFEADRRGRRFHVVPQAADPRWQDGRVLATAYERLID